MKLIRYQNESNLVYKLSSIAYQINQHWIQVSIQVVLHIVDKCSQCQLNFYIEIADIFSTQHYSLM